MSYIECVNFTKRNFTLRCAYLIGKAYLAEGDGNEADKWLSKARKLLDKSNDVKPSRSFWFKRIYYEKYTLVYPTGIQNYWWRMQKH